MAAIFADDIFKCISMNDTFAFLFELHWSLFLGVQLKISEHWFVFGLGAKATNHNLNQCRPDWLTHICGTRGRWVNMMKRSCLMLWHNSWLVLHVILRCLFAILDNLSDRRIDNKNRLEPVVFFQRQTSYGIYVVYLVALVAASLCHQSSLSS